MEGSGENCRECLLMAIFGDRYAVRPLRCETGFACEIAGAVRLTWATDLVGGIL